MFGLLAGVACSVLLVQVKQSLEEDTDTLSERLGDYVGELEERISVLEDDAARASSLGG